MNLGTVASALALPMLGWLVMRVEQLHRAHEVTKGRVERLDQLHPVTGAAHRHD